jgi:dimeric dUTPase (all-alpha-NTP-PPase superfamily)
MHIGHYVTSGRSFRYLTADKPSHRSPVIVEEYMDGGVRMLRSAEGKTFIADTYEKMYGKVKVVATSAIGKHSKKG